MTDEPASDLNQLIETAVLCFDDDVNYVEPDCPVGWDAVQKLHRRADQATLAAAVALCKSAEAKRRGGGALILAQLGHIAVSGGVFREERYRALEELLLTEMATAAKPGVLGRVCSAFGHLGDRRAVPIVLKLVDHSNRKVRFDVVMALIGCGRKEEAAIDGLIKLSTDDDFLVRDWATFGLGTQVDADTVAIRAALYARLADDDDQVIIEAIKGLARRKDKTILPALTRALREQAGTPVLGAVHESETAAPSLLCAALLEARRLLEAQRGPLPADLWHEQWLEAMAACGCPLDIGELVNLSSHDDYQVRDWATFGLGQVVVEDTAQIRAALHARLYDSTEWVRDEAIRGLARRKDKTLLPILAQELEVRVESHLLEAARDLAEPSLCAALSKARKIILEERKAGKDSKNYCSLEDWERRWQEAAAACGCQMDDA